MAHKDQDTIDALVSITRTMMGLWYTEDCAFTVGEISELVDRCAQIFQFDTPHAERELKFYVMAELVRTSKMVENTQ